MKIKILPIIKLNIILFLLCFIFPILSSCDLGTPTSSSKIDSDGLKNVEVISSQQLPEIDNMKLKSFVIIQNNNNFLVENLNFTTNSDNITIEPNSAIICSSIPPNGTCSLEFDINSTLENQVTFSISNQLSTYNKVLNLLRGNPEHKNYYLGVQSIQLNKLVDSQGIYILYPKSIIANEVGDTYTIITAVVIAYSYLPFNTIRLVDNNDNPIDTQIVSNNSGKGFSNLTVGSVVNILLKIPNNLNTQLFKMQLLHNDQLVSTSNTVYQINLTSHQGILTPLQNKIYLTSNNPTVTGSIFNSGDSPISNISITTPSEAFTIDSNCNNLTPNSICSYIVNLNNQSSISGNDNIYISSNLGFKDIVNVEYNYPDSPNLTISGDSNYITTTKNKSISGELTLTNNGNVSITNTQFTLPKFFTLSNSEVNPCNLQGNEIINTLAPKSSCNIKLTYTNGTATEISQANLKATYSYESNKTAVSNFSLTYSTIQSKAVLTITPSDSYTFPTLIANNILFETKEFLIKNIGDLPATSLTWGVDLKNLFSIDNNLTNCKSTLDFQSNCSIVVNFGPTSNIVQATSALNVSYNNSLQKVALITKLYGNSIAPNVAKINLNSINFTTVFNGGSGTQNDPYELLRGVEQQAILTYQNVNNYPASNFAIDEKTLPSGYTIANNNCNNINLMPNASCAVTLNVPNQSLGAHNLVLPSVKWEDEGGKHEEQILFQKSSTIYINIFEPITTTWFSYNSSGSPIETTIRAGEIFYVVFNMQGAYKSPPETYTINSAQLPNFLQVIGSNSCTIDPTSFSTCAVKLMVDPKAQTQTTSIMVMGKYLKQTQIPLAITAQPSSLVCNLASKTPVVSMIGFAKSVVLNCRAVTNPVHNLTFAPLKEFNIISNTCGNGEIPDGSSCDITLNYTPIANGEDNSASLNYTYTNNLNNEKQGSILIPYKSLAWHNTNLSLSDFSGSRITAMTADEYGNLYIGNNYSSVATYYKTDNGSWQWRLIKAQVDPAKDAITDIVVDKNYTLYISTISDTFGIGGDLYVLDNNGAVPICYAFSMGRPPTALLLAQNGLVLIGDGNSYISTVGETIEHVFTDKVYNIAGSSQVIGALTYDSSGTLYAGTYNPSPYFGGPANLYYLDHSSWISLDNGVVNTNQLFTIASDKSNNVYAGWRNGSIWLYNKYNKISRRIFQGYGDSDGNYPVSKLIWDNYFSALVAGLGGTGTTKQYVDARKGTGVWVCNTISNNCYNTNLNVDLSAHVNTVVSDNQGRIYAGLDNGAVYVFNAD